MTRSDNELIKYLSQYITPRRFRRMEEILQNRTRYITIALEDIYQSHNASAVLRTCECLGVQDVHIIENKNRYNINPDVALGAAKWITLKRYNMKEYNTMQAVDYLRKKGYRIVATSLEENATPLGRFNISKGSAAIFFGTELTGLSGEMLRVADEYLRIPIYGFTGSFNISVSAAIIIFHLVQMLHKSRIMWQLRESEKKKIMLQWLRNSLKRPELLEQEFRDTE